MAVTLLVWVSYAVIFLFGTICLASGLFYIAELVEEYTVTSKKVIRYSIFGVLALHVMLLLFGGWEVPELPYYNIVFGIIGHLCYLSLLRTFPFIELADVQFILCCAFALTYHCLWFWHFLYVYYPLREITAIFVLLCWSIPFAFFVSLSANDNALPGGAYVSASGDTIRKARKRNILSFFDWFSSKKRDLFGENTNYRSTGKIG